MARLCKYMYIIHIEYLCLKLYYVSGVKMLATLLKYCPQVYMNFKRKSTKGWSILNVLLDFAGGVCSISQLVLDAIISDNIEGIIGNLVKIVLGVITLVFDSVFIMQHYCLYTNSKNPNISLADEEKTLLSDDDEEVDYDY